MEELSQQKVITPLRILYPIWMCFGIFSIIYVPSILFASNDAATTAANILSNEFLFRAAIVGSLITQLIFIFAALFLYRLFKPVNKNYSLLMVVLALVSVPIAMLNTLNWIAALQLLAKPEQMMFFIKLHEQGIIIASIFWGLWLFPLGYLIYNSGYFPKILGIAVIVAGVGYTLSSFTKLLLPNLNTFLSVLEFFTFGEVVWLLWLMLKGAKLNGEKTISF